MTGIARIIKFAVPAPNHPHEVELCSHRRESCSAVTDSSADEGKWLCPAGCIGCLWACVSRICCAETKTGAVGTIPPNGFSETAATAGLLTEGLSPRGSFFAGLWRTTVGAARDT